MHIIGVDVGGTGIKAAVVDTETGNLHRDRIRIETPRPATPQAVANTLIDLLEQHQWSGPVGMGFPSAIRNGIAMSAANIDKSFIDLPIADYYSQQLAHPVFVANDADVAGLAEMRFGAGRGNSGVILFITIGTGLGSALFIDGRLLPNTELGHIYLENGIEGELFASEAVQVTQKLQWKEWSKRFNLYLTTMEKLFWPDLIVLGGGASKKIDKFSEYLTTKAPVVAATFRNQAGMIGAALFAEELLKKQQGNLP